MGIIVVAGFYNGKQVTTLISESKISREYMVITNDGVCVHPSTHKNIEQFMNHKMVNITETIIYENSSV